MATFVQFKNGYLTGEWLCVNIDHISFYHRYLPASGKEQVIIQLQGHDGDIILDHTLAEVDDAIYQTQVNDGGCH